MTRILLTAAIGFVVLPSCGTDGDVAERTAPTEHGRWGVEQAFRNRQETHMIDVAYFEFDTAASTLTTNFTGEETTFEYVRDANGISTAGNRFFDRMDFETLTDSSLVVKAEVAGYFFEIALSPQDERIDQTLVGPGE